MRNSEKLRRICSPTTLRYTDEEINHFIRFHIKGVPIWKIAFSLRFVKNILVGDGLSSYIRKEQSNEISREKTRLGLPKPAYHNRGRKMLCSLARNTKSRLIKRKIIEWFPELLKQNGAKYEKCPKCGMLGMITIVKGYFLQYYFNHILTLRQSYRCYLGVAEVLRTCNNCNREFLGSTASRYCPKCYHVKPRL